MSKGRDDEGGGRTGVRGRREKGGEAGECKAGPKRGKGKSEGRFQEVTICTVIAVCSLRGAEYRKQGENSPGESSESMRSFFWPE